MSNTRNIREPSIEALRDIVSEQQAAKFRFRINDAGTKRLVLVDLFTASAIVHAHGRSPDPVKAKIEALAAGTLGQFLRLQSAVMGVKS